MKKPFITDRKIEIYVSYLEAKLKKYEFEPVKAELYLTLKKKLIEITDIFNQEKIVYKLDSGEYYINEELLKLAESAPKLTKQIDELKKDLEHEILEKAEKALLDKISIKGEHSPEDLAEKYRKMKIEHEP